MVNFYDNYLRKCNAKGVSPSRAAIEAGTTKTSVNRWKFGSMPSDATLLKLADYFECPVSELIGFENAEPAPEEGSGRYGLSPAYWRQIGKLFRTAVLSMPKDPAWLATAQTGLSAEQVDEFLAGKRYVTKAQIHAMADRIGLQLDKIIGGLSKAFDGEEDEDVLRRQEAHSIIDSFDSESLAQTLSYLRYIASSANPPHESSPRDA